MSGYVYFAQGMSRTGKIKIGFSRFPMARLETLAERDGEKIVLLAFAPGSFKHEAAIHRLFKEHCIYSEWFHPAPEILAFIYRVKMSAQLPSDLPVSARIVFPYKDRLGRKQLGCRVSAAGAT